MKNSENTNNQNKETIERFGREKCLNAYEKAGRFIPFKPGQKFKTWQEEIASDLSITEDDAMNLWAAGNDIIQSEKLNESNSIIDKIGKEKCKEIYNEINKIMQTNKDWTNYIAKKYSIPSSDVYEILIAGMNIMMQDSSQEVAETMKSYHNNRGNLHSCPKKNCDGKLHETISQAEEYNGLYICDGCQSTFKRKN